MTTKREMERQVRQASLTTTTTTRGIQMAKSFPVFTEHYSRHYRGHADAQCFNCRDWFSPTIEPSGNARGNGQYVALCVKCNMKTWYDLPVNSPFKA